MKKQKLSYPGQVQDEFEAVRILALDRYYPWPGRWRPPVGRNSSALVQLQTKAVLVEWQVLRIAMTLSTETRAF